MSDIASVENGASVTSDAVESVDEKIAMEPLPSHVDVDADASVLIEADVQQLLADMQASMKSFSEVVFEKS